MRLWLLRQAHPDLSKLELEVSTSCLSKISLLRLLLGQTNRDKDFPESLRYSERPNIKGRLSFLPSFGEQAGGLDALYYYAPTQTRMQVAQETANNIPCDPCIDASRSSSLYQDNLTEIKVNALFGLNLIKAF